MSSARVNPERQKTQDHTFVVHTLDDNPWIDHILGFFQYRSEPVVKQQITELTLSSHKKMGAEGLEPPTSSV